MNSSDTAVTTPPLKTKIVLLGDGAVGKTSLKKKYLGLGFQERYLPTLGADIAFKKMTFDDISVQLHIWDLAGQPKFTAVRRHYYRGSAGAILVYDITQPDSLPNLKSWIDELQKCTKKIDIPLIIVGNKIDLRQKTEPILPTERGFQFMKNLEGQFGKESPLYFFETSAKTGHNVSNIFEILTEEVLKIYKEQLRTDSKSKDST